MSIARIKQHDTKGIFIDVLTVDDVPVNLTGVLGVQFLMKKPGHAINGAASVTNVSGGGVSYQPVEADVRYDGHYQQEWEVKFSDGRRLTFPNNAYNTVIIEPDLGGDPPS